MKNPKIFNYYVTTCMDLDSQAQLQMTMMLDKKGLSKTIDFVKASKETIFSMEGLTPYLKDTILDFMNEYELHFGMTDAEIAAYQNGESQPARYDFTSESHNDDGIGLEGYSPLMRLEEIRKAQEEAVASATKKLEAEAQLKKEIDEHEKTLSALEKKDRFNRDLMEILNPYEWELTLHCAAIRCMAAQPCLFKLTRSSAERACRALQDAEALVEALRKNTIARDEDSKYAREAFTDKIREERKILKELNEKLSQL